MASSPQQPQPLQRQLVRFHPFRSTAEPSFWLNHNSRKLNELRLSEEGTPMRGYFLGGNPPSVKDSSSSSVAVAKPGMRFDSSSCSSSDSSVRRNEWIQSHGKIHSLNTLESLKKLDKNAFLNEMNLPSLLKCCGILNNKEWTVSCERQLRQMNNNDDSNDDPNVALLSTTCLTYCNLKTNMTVYWFAFPALAPRPGCGIGYSSTCNNNNDNPQSVAQRRLVDAWGTRACRTLSKSFSKFRVLQEKEVQMDSCKTNNGDSSSVWCPPFFLLLPSTNGESTYGRKMKCLPLNKNTYDSLTKEEKESVIFGFVDPNTTAAAAASNNENDGILDAVGWTLRNLVAYLSLRFGLGGCDGRFLSYRSPFLRRITLSEEVVNENNEDCTMRDESYEEVDGKDDNNNDDAGVGSSLLLDISIPLATDYQWPTTSEKATTISNGTNNNDNDDDEENIMSSYKCVGWELNKNNKPGPRSIDLRPLVSPAHLSRQANDLNLRLMKWRALPSLEVEKLSQMKVLLLGAGTLGCGVARTLLGWGIRRITFVDSGRVSYSNPVRQSLFGIEDCANGGKFKAIAAAESLVTVAGPDVKSEGVVLTIPMPGHSFGKGKDGAAETEAVRRDVERLHGLIDDCDVVFLLTDTRESRWLPTVMALATETPLINAALGLDTWLVMRHGPPSSCLSSMSSASVNSNSTTAASNNNSSIGSQVQRLGCYFCSDVVAPENSTRDRTLDQQCTVTRPGLAPIAASMATELMVAMYHHPLGHCAPAPERKTNKNGTNNNSGAYAPVDDGTDASSSALGRLPHQIRGTVVTYTMMTPTIPAFPSCTACATSVVEGYRKGGFDFVKCVCCDDEDGSYLEKVSGLDLFREEAARMVEECLDWDDDDDDDE